MCDQITSFEPKYKRKTEYGPNGYDQLCNHQIGFVSCCFCFCDFIENKRFCFGSNSVSNKLWPFSLAANSDLYEVLCESVLFFVGSVFATFAIATVLNHFVREKETVGCCFFFSSICYPFIHSGRVSFSKNQLSRLYINRMFWMGMISLLQWCKAYYV